MTQEEKAKAYDKVIERAKKVLLDCTSEEQKVVEYITPELKESEDERIRKALKDYFINSFQNNGVAAILGVHIKDILTWLEKQGKQKSLDDVSKEVTKDKNAVISFLKSAGIMNDKGELAEQYRQDEQKPAEKVEPKSAWSEEDKNMLQSILDEYKSMLKEKRNWLKSLKDRVQPQPKSDWGEEDEKMLQNILECLKKGWRKLPTDILKYESWLKSLRPQNRWKPSDEQMEALDDFIYAKYPNIEKYGVAVKSLYQDLKKLKG